MGARKRDQCMCGRMNTGGADLQLAEKEASHPRLQPIRELEQNTHTHTYAGTKALIRFPTKIARTPVHPPGPRQITEPMYNTGTRVLACTKALKS